MPTLRGTSKRDVLRGMSAAETLLGLGANDILYGNGGNDTLRGGTGNDKLLGGDGHDKLLGEAGADTLDGGAGNDRLDGGSGRDIMKGGAGNDIYYVDSSLDVTVDASGTDVVYAKATYTLSQGLEALFLTGSGAINGTGNGSANTLVGNSAANTLNGGGGDDTLAGGAGADHFIGGDGTDTVSYASETSGITITYLAGYAGPGGDTYDSIERIIGTVHNDTFEMSLVAPRYVDGGGGNDTIRISQGEIAIQEPHYLAIDLSAGTVVDTSGGVPGFSFASVDNFLISEAVPGNFKVVMTGNDDANHLQASYGTTPASIDIIEGRGGNDTLTGDAPNGLHNVDHFLFDLTTAGGTDTITDFEDGGDLIRLVASQWGLTPGGSVASILTVGMGPNITSMLHFDTVSNTLSQHNQPTAPENLAILQGFSGTFSAADFILV